MTYRINPLFRLTALATALTLAACGGGDESDLANLDNQIVGNDADPALTSALQDQILVDPTLANQSNRNAVRPPETPTQAQYPAPAGTRAPGANARQVQLASTASGGGECQNADDFDYNRNWASRLPAAFAIPQGARITDAAGNDKGDCRSRVVTFNIGAAPQRVLDWYNGAAVRAGYSAEQQQRDGDYILAGTNEGDGGAFYLIVTPQGGGSEVALIANNGR
jgi:hypothetical protein